MEISRKDYSSHDTYSQEYSSKNCLFLVSHFLLDAIPLLIFIFFVHFIANILLEITAMIMHPLFLLF